MKTLLQISLFCLFPLLLSSCAGKMVAIDDRTQNKPNEALEDNNNGNNPKFLTDEQYRRTPQTNDVGTCRVSFLLHRSEVPQADDKVQSRSTYDECLDLAGDKLYQTDKSLAKVHFDRQDGTSVETVINRQ